MSSLQHYTGETISVGIDVHKNSYSVVSILNKTVIKKDRLVASPTELVCYLKNHFKEAKINTAYEAGFSGFHLHRFLIQHKINNIVVHPSSIEIASRERVKTDKRDALKIGTQLEAGRLHSIYIPAIERETKRMVTRLRLSLMKDRRRYANRMKALLFRFGLIVAYDDSVVSKKWIEQKLELLQKKDLPDDFKYTMEEYAKQWLAISANIKEIDKRLSEQAKTESELDNIYQSVPGIGPKSARILANELGDMSQFNNEKKLFSFTGLTPREYSSGDHRRLGSISRQGRPILRGVLVEAAWVAINRDESLNKIFVELSKRVGKKCAIVGIARRLVGRIRACVLKGEAYKSAN